MTGNGEGISNEKASTSYTFDQQVKSSDRELIELEIKLEKIEYADLHIGRTHAFLGHPSYQLTNQTAEKWD